MTELPLELSAEPEVVEQPRRIHFDWDWQRFIFGFSFEKGKYICINIGFFAIVYSKDRWSAWY